MVFVIADEKHCPMEDACFCRLLATRSGTSALSGPTAHITPARIRSRL